MEELLADEKVKRSNISMLVRCSMSKLVRFFSYSKRKYQEIQAAKSKTLKRMRKKQKKHYKK